MTKILALDLATKTGYYNGREFGSIKFPSETRVNSFWDWLRQEVYQDGEVSYDLVVIENAIGQMARALEVFHELKAVVKLVTQVAGIPLTEYSPNTVKKVFAGHGHAKKEDIIDKCLEMGYDIPYRVITKGKRQGQREYDNDIADAIAIYHTHKESVND